MERKILIIDEPNNQIYSKNGLDTFDNLNKYKGWQYTNVALKNVADWKRDNTLTIQDAYQWLDHQYKRLKTLTQGRINLYISGHYCSSTRHFLADKIAMCENIDEEEKRWINHSSVGHFDLRPKDCDDATIYCYDMRSAYASLLRLGTFYVPIKQGIYETITDKEFHRYSTGVAFGIYRCELIGHPPLWVERHKMNLYTSFDIKRIRLGGCDVRMIEDGQPNYLKYVCHPNQQYPISHCETGKNIFGEYIYLLQNIKESEPDLKIAKLTQSSIWGGCSKQYTTNKYPLVAGNDITLKENEEIDHVEVKRGGKYILHTKWVGESQFACNLARVKPFILSALKYEMARRVFVKYWDQLVYVKTDGFGSLTPISEFETDDKSIGVIGRDKVLYHQTILKRNID